jgi:hypothetical protein
MRITRNDDFQVKNRFPASARSDFPFDGKKEVLSPTSPVNQPLNPIRLATISA